MGIGCSGAHGTRRTSLDGISWGPCRLWAFWGPRRSLLSSLTPTHCRPSSNSLQLSRSLLFLFLSTTAPEAYPPSCPLGSTFTTSSVVGCWRSLIITDSRFVSIISIYILCWIIRIKLLSLLISFHIIGFALQLQKISETKRHTFHLFATIYRYFKGPHYTDVKSAIHSKSCLLC